MMTGFFLYSNSSDRPQRLLGPIEFRATLHVLRRREGVTLKDFQQKNTFQDFSTILKNKIQQLLEDMDIYGIVQSISGKNLDIFELRFSPLKYIFHS
jgi:hypothetical protein